MRLLAVALVALLPAAASAQGTNRNGERAFQRCYSCHSVNREESGLSGPNLDRIVGRSVASDSSFEYSRAFKAFARRNPRWTRPLLDRFLADPEKVVPGNQMGFFGLGDAAERKAITGYLAADE